MEAIGMAAMTPEEIEQAEEWTDKLIDDIFLTLTRNEVSPDMALCGLQGATVGVLDEHFSEGAGDRYMRAMTALMEAELARRR
jgi:hypothetical protein